MDLMRVVSHVGVEKRELTWDDAMQRGYEALSHGEELYDEIDAERGRSNIDIEKHLRRAGLKVAQADAWLAVAREPDAAAGRPRRSGGSLSTTAAAEEDQAIMPNPVDLEPQAKAVVDANANPPYLFELGPDQGRRTIDELQSGPVKKPTIDIEDTIVPGGPSGGVGAHPAPQGLPACWRQSSTSTATAGSSATTTPDRLIRELAVGAQAAVVFPNYSRSPEAEYPMAIQECYAVAKWVAEHGQGEGLDGSRIAIAGDSVGGNMSAAVTLLGRSSAAVRRSTRCSSTRCRRQLRYRVLPSVLLATTLRRPPLHAWYWDQYTTDPAQRARPTASRCAPASSSSPACRPPWSSPPKLTWSATRARPMPTSSAKLASPSPPTASKPSSTASSCSTPSRTPAPPGAPSPWPPTLRTGLSDKD